MSLPDKRYLPRWEVKNRISYQLHEDHQMQDCMSRDLSSVGICLETREFLPINKKVKLVVYLSETTSFPAEGHVVWSQATANGNISGILFDGITNQEQELILQHAFEVKHEDLVKHWFSGWKE